MRLYIKHLLWGTPIEAQVPVRFMSKFQNSFYMNITTNDDLYDTIYMMASALINRSTKTHDIKNFINNTDLTVFHLCIHRE